MRTDKIICVSGELLKLYGQKRVSRSAAAMSYFLLLTVFPLLICLNAMLGSMFPSAERFGNFAAGILPEGTIRFITDYLQYVNSGRGGKILPAGLALMCTSSAAAFRSIHNVMADLRGKPRFQTIAFWPLSFLFSLLFLAAMYFAVLVVLFGRQLLQSAASVFRLGDFSGVWQALRFPLLFFILLTMFWGLYRLTAPKEERGEQLPGCGGRRGSSLGAFFRFRRDVHQICTGLRVARIADYFGAVAVFVLHDCHSGLRAEYRAFATKK